MHAIPSTALDAVDLVKTYPAGRGKHPVHALNGLSTEVEAGSVFATARARTAPASRPPSRSSPRSRGPDSGQATRRRPRRAASNRTGCRRSIGLVSQKSSSATRWRPAARISCWRRASRACPRSDARDPGGGTARPVRPRRCGRPAGASTYSGGMAPQAGRRHRAGAPAAGAVPGRADHRPRPRGAGARCGPRSPARPRDEQMTVLLTTHYLDEADHLADRLAIVDEGRVVVEGTPEELKRELRGDTVQVDLAHRRSGGGRRCPAGAARSARDRGGGHRRCAPAPTSAPRRSRRCSRRSTPPASRSPSVTRRPAVPGRRLPALRRPPDARPRHERHDDHVDWSGGRRVAVTADHSTPQWPLGLFARHSALLMARGVRTLWRQPAYAAITLIQPIIWLLLFGQLFKASSACPGSPRACPTWSSSLPA